ncbi:MAG TPA: DUF1588 domain-containing protein [Nannocystaceae bacterium]|nr:DUF1588 domain-containing protein [Nannocystaceae bacterium]
MRGSNRQELRAVGLAAIALGLGLAACYSGTGARPDASGGILTIGDDGIDDVGDGDDDGGIEELEPAPGGIRRLLARQNVESVRSVLGDEAAAAAKPPADDALGAFATIAAVELALPPVAIEQYHASATAVAKAAVASPGRLGEIVPCVVGGPQDDACYAAIARDLGHLAWRRPLEQIEIDELVAIASQARAIDDGDFDAGVEWLLATMLQAVDFVYVVELGVDGGGTDRELTGPELATRMSMVLVGRAADADLLARAEAGELADSAAIREVAQELVALPESRAPLLSFFDELLRLPELPTRAKDPALVPQFTPELTAAMREETMRLVDDVVFTGGDTLELLVAEHTFVDAQLAALYGVAAPAAGFERVELPPEQHRVGVLGHASLLANLSHPDRTSPTRRGGFVQKNLLCTVIPPPPADVDTDLPPPSQAETLRERLSAHVQNATCNGCHSQMDPLGFAFENFDPIGAYRTQEGTATIDASGSIDGMGEFQNAAELAWILHDDPRVPACLVRNLYRWAVGHIDDEGQELALADLAERFAAADHAFETLAVELVASPVFRRVGAPK